MDAPQLVFGFGKSLFGILFKEEVQEVYSRDNDTNMYSLFTTLDYQNHIHYAYLGNNITLGCLDNVFASYDNCGALAIHSILS